MIKLVKSVKVTWNDVALPRFSFYMDEKLAMRYIDKYCSGTGVSASRVWMNTVTRLLNMENVDDKAFYEKHIGKTCVDITPDYAIPVSKPVSVNKPVVDKPYTPKQGEFEFSANPKNVEAGKIGGYASAGSIRTKTDRAKRGTVMVATMHQLVKRAYWRCMSLRKRQRAAGIKMTTWSEYKIAHPEVFQAKLPFGA